jgi:hypothetical protein
MECVRMRGMVLMVVEVLGPSRIVGLCLVSDD